MPVSRQQHASSPPATEYAITIPGRSRPVTSNQAGVHARLAEIVARHLKTPNRRPIATHTVAAFHQAARWAEPLARPLILDSGCGIGESTARLAQRHPDALVIGVDKSRHRLDKHRPPPDLDTLKNYRLVQAELGDFWRLATAAGWRVTHHYLFYPNPWPKAAHVQYRWHGSPAFPALLRLGGQLEIRSNWNAYIEEFAAALQIAGYGCRVEELAAIQPLTPFERKYYASGHRLWRCQADLGPADADAFRPAAADMRYSETFNYREAK